MLIIRKLVLAFKGWRQNNPAMTAAGLSYFTLFSIVPIFVISISVAGFFFEKPAIKEKIVKSLVDWFNPQVVNAAQMLLSAGDKMEAHATLVGLLLLLWAASRIFLHLQNALNVVWEVKKDNRSLLERILGRFRVLIMIAILSVFVLILTVVNVAFLLLKGGILKSFPVFIAHSIFPLISHGVSFLLLLLLFSLLYKFLPERKVRWSSAWSGAVVSLIILTVGRYLISLYFSFSEMAQAYGAAGSLVVLLIWVYFAIHIFLFGAEFAHVTEEAFRQGQLRSRPRP